MNDDAREQSQTRTFDCALHAQLLLHAEALSLGENLIAHILTRTPLFSVKLESGVQTEHYLLNLNN